MKRKILYNCTFIIFGKCATVWPCHSGDNVNNLVPFVISVCRLYGCTPLVAYSHTKLGSCRQTAAGPHAVRRCSVPSMVRVRSACGAAFTSALYSTWCGTNEFCMQSQPRCSPTSMDPIINRSLWHSPQRCRPDDVSWIQCQGPPAAQPDGATTSLPAAFGWPRLGPQWSRGSLRWAESQMSLYDMDCKSSVQLMVPSAVVESRTFLANMRKRHAQLKGDRVP